MKKWTRAALARRIEAYFEQQGVKSLPGLAVFLELDGAALAEQLETPGCLQPLFLAAKTRIERDIVENGLKGAYNASFSSFLLKTAFGYSEKAAPQPAGLEVELSDELRRYAV